MLNIYGLIVQSVMDRVENSTLTWVRTEHIVAVRYWSSIGVVLEWYWSSSGVVLE